MWQNLIVSCIVAAAALRAGAKYLPAGWRRQVVYLLSRRLSLRLYPPGARQARVAAWLNTESSCGGGCSSCKACADVAPPPEAEAEAGARRVIKLQKAPA